MKQVNTLAEIIETGVKCDISMFVLRSVLLFLTSLTPLVGYSQVVDTTARDNTRKQLQQELKKQVQNNQQQDAPAKFRTQQQSQATKQALYATNLQSGLSRKTIDVPTAIKEAFKQKNKDIEEIKAEYRSALLEIMADETAGNITTQDADRKIEEVKAIKKASISKIENFYIRQSRLIFALESDKTLRLFPAKSSYMTMLYYNSNKTVDVFQNISLNYWSDNAAFKNEVVAGYLPALRLDVSTALTKNRTATVDLSNIGSTANTQLNKIINSVDSTNRSNSSINKIISGGGEVMMNIRTPLAHLRIGEDESFKFLLKSDILVNGSLDAPLAPNYIKRRDATYFGFAAINVDMLFPIPTWTSTNSRTTAFSIAAKFTGRAVTGSDAFYKNIGIEKDIFTTREIFIGLNVNNVLIYYNSQSFSKPILEGQERIGITFTKNI